MVYGKRSLVLKMPGDEWQKNANLRLLYGYMYGHPGKKLLFMGGEFGQWKEWVHEEGLEWDALQYHFHQGIQRWVKDLNRVYRNEPALYELDFSSDGFRWVDFSDAEQSIISFTRQGKTAGDVVLVVCNLTPVPRYNYRTGVPCGGFWRELLNSDAKIYGGSGHGNTGGVESSPIPSHGKFHSLSLTLPPLGMLMFKNRGEQVRV